MRVTILCGASRVFGLEMMALTVARGLRARGHEVYFLVSGWNDGDFIQRLRAEDVPFQTVRFGKISKSLRPTPLRYTIDALLKLPGARRRCRQHLASFAPDAVIVYNRDWALLARPLLRRQRTIFHVQDLSNPSAWTRWAYRRLARSTSAFAAVSAHIADRLAKFGVDPAKTIVVYNGQEACESSARAGGREESGVPTIGIVGQVGAWKGHDDLVAALGILRDAGEGFRCDIYGQGVPEYAAALREQIERSQLSDRVTWRGYVRDTATIYRDMDVCVVPSRFDDPCPVVAIEASLRGIPVVATRRGGLPEIVVDGQTGFLVDARSPAQLAERIQMLIASKALRERLGERARRRAMATFTADRMVTDIERLCAGVASVS